MFHVVRPESLIQENSKKFKKQQLEKSKPKNESQIETSKKSENMKKQIYKQFPGKPAAEVSYKNKLTYRSVPVLSNTRVPQSNARAPDFNLQYKLTC